MWNLRSLQKYENFTSKFPNDTKNVAFLLFLLSFILFMNYLVRRNQGF